jgi:hypothetical protein
MSVRAAKGAGTLAQLVHERQDLVGRRHAIDKHWFAALGRGDEAESERARKGLASLDAATELRRLAFASHRSRYHAS